MKNNYINNLIKNGMSLNQISTITGVSIKILRLLKTDKIPDIVSMMDGKYIPSKTVMTSQIKEKIKLRNENLRKVGK